MNYYCYNTDAEEMGALEDIKDEYEVDPINDLRPVCPNCHAMLHRKKPPLTIEELETIINS